MQVPSSHCSHNFLTSSIGESSTRLSIFYVQNNRDSTIHRCGRRVQRFNRKRCARVYRPQKSQWGHVVFLFVRKRAYSEGKKLVLRFFPLNNRFQTIRMSKSRMNVSHTMFFDRFSRLSNVSALLLNIAMFNAFADSQDLRGAAYSLLASVCSSIKYDGELFLPAGSSLHSSWP